MKFSTIKRFQALSPLLILGTTGVSSATSIFTIEIGSAEVNHTNGSGLSSSSTHYTAVSGPALPSGVTFDLVVTSTGFAGSTGPGAQGGGLGVQGGQAASGIDNNFNGTGGTATTAVETLTFTVSNVTLGYTIDLIGFKSNFAADAGANTEFFNIDGGAATPFPTAQSDITFPAASSVTIGALDDDGITGSDSRFVVQQLTFDATAVPEPSTSFLGLLAGLCLLRRRRA